MGLTRLLARLSRDSKKGERHTSSLDQAVKQDPTLMRIHEVLPRLRPYLREPYGEGKQLVVERISLDKHIPSEQGVIWWNNPSERCFYIGRKGGQGFHQVLWWDKDITGGGKFSGVYKIIDVESGDVLYHNPDVEYDYQEALNNQKQKKSTKVALTNSK